MPESILSAQEEEIAKSVLSQIFQGGLNFEVCSATVNAVVGGKTFGQGLGLKEADHDVIIGLAASRYMAARYDDAARLYSFASLLNHFDTKALQGAALSLQKLGSHEAALQYLSAILLQEPGNIEVTTLAAESLAMSGNKQEAIKLLRQITELAKNADDPQRNKPFVDRASALLSLISNDSGLERN